jgi:hypothetical protein
MEARVTDESRILRFGITVDGKRARWWRLRSGAKSAELYLEREGSGQHAHLSMHRSGEWHLDVNGDWPVEWQRPPGLALDRRRAFALVQHIGMAVVDEPAVERAVLHPVPADTDRTIATVFDVWIEDPDTDHGAWPGKDAGTAFIGRLPIAGGRSTCCVVADRVRPDMEALPPLVLTADEVETMRAAGVLTFPSVAVAHDQDGTILLIERWAGLPADEPEAAG